MRKIILALALTLGLGACSSLNTLQQATGYIASPTTVYVARNTFDGIEATATNYIRYCTAHRGAQGCSDTGIKAIIPAVRSGRVARTNLTNYAKTNPGSGTPVALYNALISATNTLQQIAFIYNIGAVGK